MRSFERKHHNPRAEAINRLLHSQTLLTTSNTHLRVQSVALALLLVLTSSASFYLGLILGRL